MNRINELIEQGFPEAVRWRRMFHMKPELSYTEAETSRFIADRLQEWGLEVRTGVGGHGVTGLLRGGKPGPTVALRADMDALPIQDEKQCEYASQVAGIMHACGHDGHISALLLAARSFAALREELPGSVLFLFQPAEEQSPGGALPMIEAGALDGVDAIYGVHLWTPFPAGTVASAAGALMASADEFVIEIAGRGGHGGLPHEAVDSIVAASHLVVNLQTIVSRNINPAEPAVVSIGSIHAGQAFNVIAERCVLNGTARSFNEQVREEIQQRIGQMAEQTCALFGAKAKIDYIWGYPPVVNPEAEANRFFKVAEREFGESRVMKSPLIMAGEDFAYYLKKIPGCFMFVGAGAEQNAVYPHHHPKFDIDERAICQSAILLSQMALDFLAEAQAR